MKKHKIISIVPGSIAQELELASGDFLMTINGQEIKDMLDYRWLTDDENLLIEIEKPEGEIWELEIEKDSGADLGINFAAGALGEDKRCQNACIFCFVDQQPPGLRGSLYVKDDDPYQSFAVGNYVTLTNLNDSDIGQIIKYRLSPMRISVHAADTELRQQMMGSPRAKDLFGILEKFSQAGIDMHFQAVLCKGINDGRQLDYTIEQLLRLGERARSLAVVPVGLTRHRDGLYPLEAFTREDAAAVIAQVEKWQARRREIVDGRFVFLADEWYVLAGKVLPEYGEYEDFPQLDNGVGMMALFEEEFLGALVELRAGTAGEQSSPLQNTVASFSSLRCFESLCVGANSVRPHDLPTDMRIANPIKARIGIITGHAAAAFMEKLSKRYTESFPDIAIDIHVIENEFYGPGVTVSGLITGQDIINQLKGRCGGLDVMFVPENAFRTGTEDMLCGATLGGLAEALGMKVVKGSADGGEFCKQLCEFQ